ncbi:DUF4304 domain-containing protein [Paenibacillus sp. PAMC21692]|uniref:DUF4304 domain-containing protein n=1 Tax=Paenibacillus sp. PAMC21692 TaxID=2762320 RepID=UPI00164EA8D9|nr:DUF4304 domain-containing protein [Paenibacillus sp. PAMC21692]QNK54710.1 DUF4304 domain-containing protein [Paenibacillus sp. PAMC21692]
MSLERDKMISSLKDIVIPSLPERGFKGTFPHFRRVTEKKIDLLTFQFDKYGGGFIIEIADCPPEGHIHHWGEKVPPNKVTAHDLHPNNRQRIGDKDEWFRYDKRTFFGNIYDKVAHEVFKNLSQADDYWSITDFR